jgi:hypothetical protein
VGHEFSAGILKQLMGVRTEELIPGLLKILIIPSQFPVDATWLNVNIRVLQG